MPEPSHPDLRHHGDQEVGVGLLDFAVNVHHAPMPSWLRAALLGSLDDLSSYPDPSAAESALARSHRREPAETLATSGAAEAFTLIARLRPWREPVVVHPQFTEPDVALQAAGHRPRHVLLDEDFTLDAARIPRDADLVMVGNPTNPTGVRHPRETLLKLARPGRLVVVDEAFCDDGVESLIEAPTPGLVVVRSLTKIWAVAGLRAGYLLGEPATIAGLRALQTPWSVSGPAAAVMVACAAREAREEQAARVDDIARWRDHLAAGLARLGIEHVPSTAPFVLARPGVGAHADLRRRGFAVRRCDTFPGLDEAWIRIAVRPPEITGQLLAALGETTAPR